MISVEAFMKLNISNLRASLFVAAGSTSLLTTYLQPMSGNQRRSHFAQTLRSILSKISLRLSSPLITSKSFVTWGPTRCGSSGATAHFPAGQPWYEGCVVRYALDCAHDPVPGQETGQGARSLGAGKGSLTCLVEKLLRPRHVHDVQNMLKGLNGNP